MIESRLSLLNNLIDSCVCTYKQAPLSINHALEHFQSFLSRKNCGIAYIIGNGGSAGIASHFCTDLIRTLNIPASTLTDSNVTTCLSNDFGYEAIFSRQLDLLIKEHDLLIAISSSGQSNNIINAVDVAKNKQVNVITLSGFDINNPLRSKGDLNFYLNSHDYGLVEMGHFFLLHTLIDTWKNNNTSFISAAYE